MTTDGGWMNSRLLLKLGTGLTVGLLSGVFLVFIIFRSPPDSDSKTVIHGSVESPPQTFRINSQPRSGGLVGNKDEEIALNEKKHPIGTQRSQDPVTQLPEGQSTTTIGSEPTKIAESSTISKENTPPVTSTETYSQVPSYKKEHQAQKLETTIAAVSPTMTLSSVEIGPIITEQELKKVSSILHRNGFDFQHAPGVGNVKLTRLLYGVYSREKVHRRFKEVQDVVDTAFIIPENEKFAIYVATYRDPAKAIQRLKDLAQKNIHATAVATEIEMKGTILVMKQVSESSIEPITEQILKMGLSIKINR
jgi:hypothetical protein